jgi:hypothetical protein
MKLYTEEQVKDAYLQGWYDGSIGMAYTDRREDAFELLTPIELPSDEEIGVIALNIADTLKDSLDSREEAFYLAGFQTCAKWMKEQILKQNK